MSDESTRQQIAARCANIMWPDDHAARGLGIELASVGPGTARLTMTVRQDMVNGHGVCHGGFIFTVADCAFAYASNTTNQRAVAASADINFLVPAHLGDVLTSVGKMRHQGGRSGLYDIEVSNQHGQLIALFRGHAMRLKSRFFDDDNDSQEAAD